MDNAEIKKLRLQGIVFNPALNDGNNGLIRCEASQWILDKGGNVTTEEMATAYWAYRQQKLKEKSSNNTGGKNG